MGDGRGNRLVASLARPCHRGELGTTPPRIELGAGYHILTGRARDEAGNLETSYEIARLVVPPQASPDLRGSSRSSIATDRAAG